MLQGEVIHTGEWEVRGECCDEGAAGRSDTGEWEVRGECCDESAAGRSDTYR